MIEGLVVNHTNNLRRSEEMEETESKEEEKDMELKQKKEEKEEMKATATATTHNLRRSKRNPSQSVLSLSTFKDLERKLKINDPEVVVLRCKEYLNADSSSEIINAMLTALESNTNCQGLYLQVRDQANISFSITIMIITYKVSYNLF